MKYIRTSVFFPALLLLGGPLLFSIMDYPGFVRITRDLNHWVLAYFSSVFSWGALSFLLVTLFVLFTPLARVRLGGAQARPLLPVWKWFCVTLCTTIAVGILFWATAEPIFHLHQPPESLGLVPGSYASAQFAMSTLFLHWTLIPYAIYTLPGLMFAFAYYNMGQKFSLASCLSPLFPNRPKLLDSSIDLVCLYALVAGMAASLGSGVLTLAGGVESLYGIQSRPLVWASICLLIVCSFVASSVSGLNRGIKLLSDLNARIFLFLVFFVLVFGPTRFIYDFGIDAWVQHMSSFFKMSVSSGFTASDPWPQKWTVFYWANWLAWAPATAIFLGRISYGYTIRSFILMNLFAPALFGALWMAVFGGMAIHLDLVQNLPVHKVLTEKGPEGMAYFVFQHLPLARVLIPIFLITVFLSYVTGADSNTSVLAGMSSHGISPETPEPAFWLKVLWGALIGILSVVMLKMAGLDGIRMLSDLGGVPALLFEILVMVCVLAICMRPKRFDLLKTEG